jgi:hypothetical protein
MRRLTPNRPSPAMLVALVALCVALGGTSYAATKLPRNSVSSRQLKNNSITSPKVKDRSLKAQDFAAGALPAGERGLQGPQGDRGPQGERGAQGAQGETGTVDTTTFFTKTQSDGRYLQQSATAANSNQLGGQPASAYLRGNGQRRLGQQTAFAGDSATFPLGTIAELVTTCSDPASASVRVRMTPTHSGSVFTDNESGTTTFEALGPSASSTPVAAPAAKHVEWRVGSAGELHNVEAWVITGPGGSNSCRVDLLVESNV